MQWLITIIFLIVAVLIFLLILSLLISGIMATYSSIRYRHPFFKTWVEKFKELLVDVIFEALIPFNWF